MLSKEDLITRAVEAVMDETECRLGFLMDSIKKKHEEDHDKAVKELAELVFAEYAKKGQVETAIGRIGDGLNDVVYLVGDKMYLQGFIDAAALLGVHITQEDIQAKRDEENSKRTMSVVKYLLDEEAKRIGKMYGVPVSIKVEGELAL